MGVPPPPGVLYDSPPDSWTILKSNESTFSCENTYLIGVLMNFNQTQKQDSVKPFEGSLKDFP